jgi:hypothetical protein
MPAPRRLPRELASLSVTSWRVLWRNALLPTQGTPGHQPGADALADTCRFFTWNDQGALGTVMLGS